MLCCFLLTATAFAEPNQPSKTEPNEAIETHMVLSKGDLFNKEFAAIFAKYVDDRGLVNYSKLHRYRLELSAVLAQIALLENSRYENWSENEQKAFWINSYNLCLLDIIIKNYPIESNRLRRLWWPPDSIRHIEPIGVLGSPKWNNYKYIIMDEEFTLYEIEKRFFREKFDDPRIFLVLHCASLGGPLLRNEPYYGQSLDKQLNEQAKKYFNTPAGIDIRQNKDKVYISVLFLNRRPWFGMEFTEKYTIDRKFKSHPPNIRAALNFISKYISDPDVDYLETGNYKVEFKAYDWRLNSQ